MPLNRAREMAERFFCCLTLALQPLVEVLGCDFGIWHKCALILLDNRTNMQAQDMKDVLSWEILMWAGSIALPFLDLCETFYPTFYLNRLTFDFYILGFLQMNVTTLSLFPIKLYFHLLFPPLR